MKKERELNDKNKSIISIFVIVAVVVILFVYLFFSTNLFNFDAEGMARIKKVDEGLNVEIPNVVIEDYEDVNNKGEGIVIPSILDISPIDLQNYDFIAHPLYPAFAEPHSTSINNNLLRVSDTIIYNTGYYSINGSAWQTYTLQGNPYTTGSPWLLDGGTSNLNLPSQGTHYVLVYSCSLVNNAWDCHENKWQLNIISGSSTPPSGGSSFKFVAWGDTKTARSILSQISDEAVLLDPVFTIYAGDLESNGFTTSGMNLWKDAMNGELTGDSSPNGMFDKTFSIRGNHDGSNTAGWQSYFDFRQMANSIGATNYAEMSGSSDLTYSFDYGNSHFVGVDVLGDVSYFSSVESIWLSDDLDAAENRGLTHAFIFFHGPIYCVDYGHCSCSTRLGCNPPQRLIDVINAHPIVSATFHGHEHTYAYTYLDNTRIPSITHPFHQIIAGDAGAGSSSCNSNRCDYNMVSHGFVTVDVDQNNVLVTWYKQGSTSAQHTLSFTK